MQSIKPVSATTVLRSLKRFFIDHRKCVISGESMQVSSGIYACNILYGQSGTFNHFFTVLCNFLEMDQLPLDFSSENFASVLQFLPLSPRIKMMALLASGKAKWMMVPLILS